MNNKQMEKYICDNYWKDNQKVLLETWYDAKDMKKKNSYFEQELNYKDYTLINIQTWDMLKYTDSIAHTPYCIHGKFCIYQVTVPKFGQLTEKDIAKAVSYVLRQLECLPIFNIYLDGEPLPHVFMNDYEYDICMLRNLHENSN